MSGLIFGLTKEESKQIRKIDQLLKTNQSDLFDLVLPNSATSFCQLGKALHKVPVITGKAQKWPLL